MNKNVSPALIGGFVVSGIVLAVAAVILFGSGRVFDKRESFVSFFPGSVNGLPVGSNVSFRGVRVGAVTQVLLSLDSSTVVGGTDLGVPVVFEIDETLIRQRGVSLDLGNPAEIQRLISQGLSARLDSESLLTGRLYVSLDFRPGESPVMSGVTHEFPEVPTVGSSMSEVTARLQQIGERLSRVDIEAVSELMRSTLEGLNAFATSEELQGVPREVEGVLANLDVTISTVQVLAANLDSTVAPMRERAEATAESAEESLEQVERTVEALREVMDPDAPLVVGLIGTLQELEQAARALRRVSELIERDPAVLVRGRDTGGER
jgi:paraquat-inducible protein B